MYTHFFLSLLCYIPKYTVCSSVSFILMCIDEQQMSSLTFFFIGLAKRSPVLRFPVHDSHEYLFQWDKAQKKYLLFQ